MKKGFLPFAAALMFLHTAAMGQVLPTMNIGSSNGAAWVTWSSGDVGLGSLQTTTNLIRPIVWADEQVAWLGGATNVPAVLPLQFFRVTQLAPIFSYSIFYDVNLEIDPGQAMTITAPVFCNQNIWEGSSFLTFNSSVTAVGTNAAQVADPFANNYSGTGTPTFNAGPPVTHAAPLSLAGMGTNYSPAAMRSILELPPAAYSMGTPGAYSSNGIVYLANACDLVISNFANGANFGVYLPHGTNMVVYYQDYSLTQIPYDYYMVSNANNHTTYTTNYVSPRTIGPNTNIYYAGFSWITNGAFVDWREGWNGGAGPAKQVQAVQIDMNLLQQWLTNNAGNGVFNSGYNFDQLKTLHTGGHIGSIYVYNSVPLTSGQLPAVRVTNGGQLPHPGGSTRGLTVATPFPIYVWKDYNVTNNGVSSRGSTNTANTLPAALMGDAITILSDNWHDASVLPSQLASATTVNAAMITGIVPTVGTNYSGGMENFVRLLENWGGSTLTYNGSIVVLYNSKYATNTWSYGNYYDAPSRNWGHDANFSGGRLPPLTPWVENYLSP